MQGYACLLMIPTTVYILGFISHHIMPLVINSLVGGHTYAYQLHGQKQHKKPGAPGLEI